MPKPPPCFPRLIRLLAIALFALTPILHAAGLTTAPITEPASQPTTGPSSISLNFKDAPLDKVLDLLSKSLGLSVVTDGPVDGHVTLISRQPVSADQAVTMLNAGLKANGFTVVRDGQMLRIVARDKARKGNLPVHFGNKADEIADTDELITQVIPLTSVSAAKLRDDLKPMISADVDITANEESNSIIISDTSSAVRRIVEIISRLDDQQASTTELRIVQLKHADATETAKLIDTLFKPPSSGQAMNPQMRMMMQQQGQPVPPETPENHAEHVVTAADVRTNTLMVVASAPTLKMIDHLLLTIDSDNPNPAPPAEISTFALKFADAEETARIVTDIFKAPKESPRFPLFFGFDEDQQQKKASVEVNAISDARTNTVIVTAPHDKFAAIQKLITELDDHPMTSGGVRVLHLKYADADSVSFLIEDMFKPKAGESAPRNPFFEEYFGGSGDDKPQARNPKVNVTSDSRTNTLIVSAPTDLLDVIERVVHELDADPTSEDTLFIYHLRNSQAANLETVLNVLFGNVNNPQQNQPGQNGQPGQPGQNGQMQNQQLRQANEDSGTSVTQSPSTLGNPSRTSSQANNRLAQSALHKLSPNNAQAVNELTGKVFVVADLDTNSLLVTTATKFEKQVRRIIDDLDQPVPQVLIKVLIAEVTHDNSEDTGLDFSLLNVRPSGYGTSGGDALGDAAAATANGGLVVTVLEKNVAATLHALSTAGKLDVLSRPYILASDNQEASILVGESVPFITESRLDSLNNTVNTVQYQDIGIQLDVTPHINPDGLVILDVSPQISSMTNTNIQLSAGVESPVFQRRSAQSHVAIMNGKTIVIGGLMQDQKTSTVTGVPILEDLPFVGRAFQRRQTDKTKTELLIFLTPHVAQRPDALAPMSDDEIKGTKLTPHAVAPGVFQNHMRGMRRGDNAASQSTQPVSPVDSIDLGDSADHTATTQPADRQE